MPVRAPLTTAVSDKFRCHLENLIGEHITLSTQFGEIEIRLARHQTPGMKILHHRAQILKRLERLSGEILYFAGVVREENLREEREAARLPKTVQIFSILTDRELIGESHPPEAAPASDQEFQAILDEETAPEARVNPAAGWTDYESCRSPFLSEEQ